MIKKYLKKLRDDAVDKYLSDILDLVEKNHGGRMLDCGCHDGDWTSKLAQKGNYKNEQVYGIEVNNEAIRDAEKLGYAVMQGNLNERFDFEDRMFEMVHANQVIEHLYDTGKFLSEINRVMKKDGYLIICTENLSSWHNIGAQILGYQPFSLTNISPNYFNIGNPLTLHYRDKLEHISSWQHVRVFAYRGLIEHIEEFGFKVVEVRGAGYYPFNLLAKYDPKHSAFLTIKAKKIKDYEQKF